MKNNTLGIDEVKRLLEQDAYIKRVMFDDGTEEICIRIKGVPNWSEAPISQSVWDGLRNEDFIVFQEETHHRRGRSQRWVYWEEMCQG